MLNYLGVLALVLLALPGFHGHRVHRHLQQLDGGAGPAIAEASVASEDAAKLSGPAAYALTNPAAATAAAAGLGTEVTPAGGGPSGPLSAAAAVNAAAFVVSPTQLRDPRSNER